MADFNETVTETIRFDVDLVDATGRDYTFPVQIRDVKLRAWGVIDRDPRECETNEELEDRTEVHGKFVDAIAAEILTGSKLGRGRDARWYVDLIEEIAADSFYTLREGGA